MASISRSSFLPSSTPVATSPGAAQGGALPISQASPFRRFAAGFGGNFGQLVQEEQGQVRAQQERQKQIQKLRQDALKEVQTTIKSFEESILKAPNVEAINRIAQSFQSLAPKIRETLELAGQNPDMANFTISNAIARFQTAGEKALQKGQASRAELAGQLQRRPTEAEFARKAGVAPPQPTGREQQIAGLVRRGLDENLATDIVDKRVTIQVEPFSGQLLAVNIVDGTSKRITLPSRTAQPPAAGAAPAIQPTPGATPAPVGAAPVVPSAPAAPRTVLGVTPSAPPATEPTPTVTTDDTGAPQTSIFNDLDALGAIPFFAEKAGRVFGQFIEAANFPEITASRSRLRGLREEIIQALAKSGRPPVVEQARILEDFPSLGPAESPRRAKEIFKSLKGRLENIRTADEEFAADPNNPTTLRVKALDRVRAVARVLLQIGTPSEDDGDPTGLPRFRIEGGQLVPVQ